MHRDKCQRAYADYLNDENVRGNKYTIEIVLSHITEINYFNQCLPAKDVNAVFRHHLKIYILLIGTLFLMNYVI